MLLADEEWAKWTDREIARHCAVHHSFVSRVRPSLSPSDSEPAQPRTYTTKHGTQVVLRGYFLAGFGAGLGVGESEVLRA